MGAGQVRRLGASPESASHGDIRRRSSTAGVTPPGQDRSGGSGREAALLAGGDPAAGGLDQPVSLVTRLGRGARAEDVRAVLGCREVVALVDVAVEDRE